MGAVIPLPKPMTASQRRLHKLLVASLAQVEATFAKADLEIEKLSDVGADLNRMSDRLIEALTIPEAS